MDNVVRSSPFRPSDEPILFPFLILEAKSEVSSESFYDIDMQTASSIRTLLELQDELQAQVTAAVTEGGPLVWFFSNRGSHWRVKGCYITNDNPVRYVSLARSTCEKSQRPLPLDIAITPNSE